MRASSDLNGFPRRIEVLDRQAPCPEYHCLLAEVFEGARCWNVASQVLNIQELLDYTLDYLSNSPTDLISCALVAKAWVSPAQRHIYRHLDLTPDDSAYHEVKFHQVCHTLENNPHLIPLVRRVSVPLNSCALTDVTCVPFTHLADFRLECTSYPWATRAQLNTVSPLQKLLRLPCLRRVMLWGYLEPISIIDEYFYLCSPNIRQLLLALDNLDEYPGLYPECAILGHPQFTSKPKIALMHLSVPRELEGRMRGPRCPFGFAQLRSLEIRGSDWPALQEIFAPCLPQLELLWLTPRTSAASCPFLESTNFILQFPLIQTSI